MSTATFVQVEELKAERDRLRGEVARLTTTLKSAERLLEMECRDVDRMLVVLGLCEADEVDERFRTEGGFLRVGRVVEAIKGMK